MRPILFVLILTVVNAVFAETVIPAKSIQLELSQSGLRPQDLKGELSVRCTYKAGIFWPETELCGQSKLPVPISSSGLVQIPAVGAFDNLHGHNIKNFAIDLDLTLLNNTTVVSLRGRGKEQIRAIQNLNVPVQILKLPGQKMKLTYQGHDLFQTPLVRAPQAYLFVTVAGEEQIDVSKNFTLSSLHSWWNLGAENRDYTSPDKQLKNKTEILIPDDYYATIKPIKNQRLLVHVRYEDKPGANAFQLAGRQYHPLTLDGVRNLPEIELKEDRP